MAIHTPRSRNFTALTCTISMRPSPWTRAMSMTLDWPPMRRRSNTTLDWSVTWPACPAISFPKGTTSLKAVCRGGDMTTRHSGTGAGYDPQYLEALIEEATVDCYNEHEQAAGLFTKLDEELDLPFTTRILGMEGVVVA